MKTVLVLTALLLAAPTFAIVLVDGGRPLATVILPADASPGLGRAADRLRAAVEEVTGVRLPVAVDGEPVSTAGRVLVGLPPADAPDTGEDRLGYDGCYVRARGDELVFLGPRDAGVLNGVSWFVEWQLGVHVLGFGALDRVVPQRAAVAVADFEVAHRPSFAWRQSWTSAVRGEEGYIRVLDPIEDARAEAYYEANRRGGVSLSGSHSLYQYVPDSLFAVHPEYFPLLDGQRAFQSPRDGSVQRELSHPGVLALVVERLRAQYGVDAVAYATVSPNDDPYWSQSPEDLAMAADPAARMLEFCNRVVAALEATHPRLGACFLAYSYSSTMEPPLDRRAHDRVVPMVAPLGACPVHGPHSDACPDHAQMRRIYEGWTEVAAKVVNYPYIYANILPLPTPAIVAEEIGYYHDLGLFGVQREHMARGFGWELSYWLEWQLLWDAEADVVQLRRVFLEGWYGEAAAPMTRILERLEAVVAAAPAGAMMAERDVVRYWRGWFRGWTDSFNQLPALLLPTVAANDEDLAEARRRADTPAARAHVERAAADLAAMAAYAAGRVAFDAWDTEPTPAHRAAALAEVEAGVATLEPLRAVSERGVHAQLGQLRRLRTALLDTAAATAP